MLNKQLIKSNKLNSRNDNYEMLRLMGIFINKLNEESNKGALIVVEGPKDIQALYSLGYIGNIYPLNHGGSIDKLLSKIRKYNKLILLLDTDNEGNNLTKRISKIGQEQHLLIDISLRKELIRITNGKIRNIENLQKIFIEII